MIKKIVTGEMPFQVQAHSFSVYSEAGYTLNYSADGVHYTAYSDATPAGETLIVNGVAKGMFFKLAGNTGEATITY